MRTEDAGAIPSQQRDGRIDLYRGMALLFIFWDHIPGNVVAQLTPRNFGFSDAAEIFVFLAGYGVALAYGQHFERDGWLRSCLRILRRAWALYVAHIFVLVLLSGIVILANARVETRDLIEEMHLGYLVQNTEHALVDALVLRFKPSLMDPLPLYIVLLLALAVALPVLVRRPARLVAGSAALYALTLGFGWTLPSAPGEAWFFNPLAWQFLFVLGAASAVAARSGAAVRLPPGLVAAAAGFMIVSALLALSWRWPELHDAVMPRRLAEWIYPIDKSSLAPLRLLHFMALACCAAVLLRPGAWQDRPIIRDVRLLGRHSLEIFCLGVILAPLADAANTLGGDRPMVQIATSVMGAAAMVAFASLLQWSRDQLLAPAAGSKLVSRHDPARGT
ncbi:OpgC family protein [Arenibaculum pallidiluteum]|uniref:OpgC family protein n=1 Tax=Arenibaculum pallidiluteum TaxID=2812559 RepID=UPI001A95BEE0|nr:OpgC domain-containing protein [Arenibaculum pallidiluteum]